MPYLRSGNHHDFGHVIHTFSFGADGDPKEPTKQMKEVKKKLAVVNPLDGVVAHTEECTFLSTFSR